MTRAAQHAWVLGAALAGLAVSLPGCRGDRSEKPPRQFLPDMDDSPKWKPQTPTEFYVDGRAMRPEVAGTVAFSRTAIDGQTLAQKPAWASEQLAQRDDLLAEDWRVYSGAREDLIEGDRQYTPEGIKLAEVAETIPFPVTPALLARGEDRFNIYCAACHGFEADGKGTVAPYWGVAPKNLHEAKYRTGAKDPQTGLPVNTGKDGYIFHVARNGLYGGDKSSRMPGYAHALSVEDTWAIVAHLRVLQASWDGKVDDVPDSAARQRLTDEQIKAKADAKAKAEMEAARKAEEARKAAEEKAKKAGQPAAGGGGGAKPEEKKAGGAN